MFHDMGLTHAHCSAMSASRSTAQTRPRFLRSHGIAQHDIDTVWTAIALHTTPGIPQHMHPVVALVKAGVEMDVLGLAYCRIQATLNASGRDGIRAPNTSRRDIISVLRRHQAQARYDIRQRQGRRARTRTPLSGAANFSA